MSDLGHEGDYFIKPGYKASSENITLNTEDRIYWDPARIQKSQKYQTYTYKIARRLLKSQKRKRFMDVGSGPGLKVQRYIDDIAHEIFLLDQLAVQEIAREIVPNAKFVAADFEDIDIDMPVKFDVIVCSDVIEHLVNPNRCVDFVRRHLSEEGVAVFSTPERDVLRGKDAAASTKPEHVREWNQKELCAYLQSRGLHVKKIYLRPQQELGTCMYAVSLLLGGIIPRPKWSSCQIAVCHR